MLNHKIIYNSDIDIRRIHSKRTAVRAVINQQNKLLLVYSQVNGDFKFPGGGVEYKESLEQALKRELLEECGVIISFITNKIGVITEYRKDYNQPESVFKMDSHYYQCEIENKTQRPNLNKYEAELGFEPHWTTPVHAFENNQQLMNSGHEYPPWTERDTFFLEYLITQIL